MKNPAVRTHQKGPFELTHFFKNVKVILKGILKVDLKIHRILKFEVVFPFLPQGVEPKWLVDFWNQF